MRGQGIAPRPWSSISRRSAILDEELGVPPLPETTELNDAILEDDIPPAPSAGRRVTAAPHQPRLPVESPMIPLVGRESDLILINGAMTPGAVLAIEGEAGIGKTRLLEELVTSLDEPVLVQAYQGEAGLAYGLIREAIEHAVRAGGEARLAGVSPDALGQAARLFPDLAPVPLPPLDTDAAAARTRLFDGVSRTLAALCGARALVIDDVHWADEASIELLSYLVRRLHRLEMTLVVTWRTEEFPPDMGCGGSWPPLTDRVVACWSNSIVSTPQQWRNSHRRFSAMTSIRESWTSSSPRPRGSRSSWSST